MPVAVGNFSANPTQALMQLAGSVPGEGAKTREIDESQFLHMHVHVHEGRVGSYRNFSFCCSVRSASLVIQSKRPRVHSQLA